MKAYRPRRSSARWLENAPEYVLACFDNGGKTCDRYTVMLGGSMWGPEMGRNVHYLAMSHAPTQGFSQFGEMPAHNRRGFGRHIRWLDLPNHIRQHVIDRVANQTVE
jgi:hypothetical protein